MIKIKFERRVLAFFLLMAASQLAYFIPAGGFLAMVAGVLIFGVCLVTGDIKLKQPRENWWLLGLFGLMVLLGAILLLFGSSGEFKKRNLFLYGAIQLALILIVLDLMKSVHLQKMIFKTFLIVILLESIIIIGQFSFLTFGFGFAKIIEYENDYGLLTGSMGNPNDSAAQLGLLLFSSTAYLVFLGKKRGAYLILFLGLPAIFFTLSRTMLVFWVLNLFAIFLTDSKFSKNSLSDRIKSVSFVIFLAGLSYFIFLYLEDAQSDVISRALLRVSSLGEAKSDNSIAFRFISHYRLFENILNLGLGSFSDLNYYKFFYSNDPWLMKVNPHSYLVEYSFLFGYLGFFVIVGLFVFFACKILLNKNLPIVFRWVACIGVFFIQAVPASLLASFYFFVPFVFLWKMRGG